MQGDPIRLKENPKLDMLDQLVDDEIDIRHKIVIFAEYREEIEMITSRYKKYGAVSVFGGNSSEKNLRNIKKFKKEDSCRIIVMNPQSASHGVNLTEAAYLIFYSISYSAEFNYQAIGRIKRATQKNHMRIFYLLATNSIDRIIYNVIVGKNKTQDQLLNQNEVDCQLVQLFRREHGVTTEGPAISQALSW